MAITPASGTAGPPGALAIGVAAGLACYWGATRLKRRFGYDDSLDAFGVHGVGGIVGALLTGVFAAPALGGSGFSPGLGLWQQLGVQALSVVVTALYSGLVSLGVLKLVDALVGLRVTDDDETRGLDLALHSEQGYNLEY